jgi:hypothetical protein
VRESNTARVLSLFRSLAFCLYEAQREGRGGKRSLPHYERSVCRQPGRLIRQMLAVRL